MKIEMEKGLKLRIINPYVQCQFLPGETVVVTGQGALGDKDWTATSQRLSDGAKYLYLPEGTTVELAETPQQYTIAKGTSLLSAGRVFPAVATAGKPLDILYKDKDLCIFAHVSGVSACVATPDLIELNATKTITLAGQDIEISAESYEAFKKQFTEE